MVILEVKFYMLSVFISYLKGFSYVESYEIRDLCKVQLQCKFDEVERHFILQAQSIYSIENSKFSVKRPPDRAQVVF